MKLDRIDINILYELQKNGRITNVELADLVNLSPSPCLMRVKRLQAEGFIFGYSSQINLGKLGPALTVFTEVTPLAVVMKSGTMSSSSQANSGPVRPKPVMTSSATNRMPWDWQSSRMAFSQPGHGTMTPPEPWIGAT